MALYSVLYTLLRRNDNGIHKKLTVQTKFDMKWKTFESKLYNKNKLMTVIV